MKLLDICIKKAPEILTGINVAGVGITAWLTHRATKKAEADLEEKPKWKYYILPGVSGAVTIAAGIGSNRISAKRLGEAIAIGALYADRVKALEGKIEEKLGKEELLKIKEEEKQKKLSDISNGGLHDGKMLCYEPESKQYFHATQQQLLMAEITANKIFKNDGKLTMNQWLQLLPECKTKPSWGDKWGWWESDEEGCADFNWSFYRGAPWIDIQPQITEKNGEPLLIIAYGMHPMERLDNNILMNKAERI